MSAAGRQLLSDPNWCCRWNRLGAAGVTPLRVGPAGSCRTACAAGGGFSRVRRFMSPCCDSAPGWRSEDRDPDAWLRGRQSPLPSGMNRARYCRAAAASGMVRRAVTRVQNHQAVVRIRHLVVIVVDPRHYSPVMSCGRFWRDPRERSAHAARRRPRGRPRIRTGLEHDRRPDIGAHAVEQQRARAGESGQRALDRREHLALTPIGSDPERGQAAVNEYAAGDDSREAAGEDASRRDSREPGLRPTPGSQS